MKTAKPRRGNAVIRAKSTRVPQSKKPRKAFGVSHRTKLAEILKLPNGAGNHSVSVVHRHDLGKRESLQLRV